MPEEGITDATAGRDLAPLVAADLLEPVGEKRGRVYLPTARLRAVRAAVRRACPPPRDPFADDRAG